MINGRILPGTVDDPSDATTSTYTPAPSIEEELRRLAIASIEAFNDKDFAFEQTPERREFLTRVSPTFHAREQRYPEPLSWEGLQHLWRDFAASEPLCRFEILNVNVDVFDNGRASVLLETSTSVHEGVRYLRMMEMKWRSSEGKWIYYSFTSMSGSQGNSGMVG